MSDWSRIRDRAGLTQQNVADAIGVSRPLVGYWESGERPMDARWLRVVGYWDQTVHDLASRLGFQIPPLPYRATCCEGDHRHRPVEVLKKGETK